MGTVADHLKSLGYGDVNLTLKGAPDYLDDVRREVGDVTQGLVLDLAILPVGPTQEGSLVDPISGVTLDSGYVDCACSLWHMPESYLARTRKSRGLPMKLSTDLSTSTGYI